MNRRPPSPLEERILPPSNDFCCPGLHRQCDWRCYVRTITPSGRANINPHTTSAATVSRRPQNPSLVGKEKREGRTCFAHSLLYPFLCRADSTLFVSSFSSSISPSFLLSLA